MPDARPSNSPPPADEPKTDWAGATRARAHVAARAATSIDGLQGRAAADADPDTDVEGRYPGEEQETAVLFVDLISSSEFASVLGLQAYAAYVDSFEDLCREQCRHFFQTFHANKYEAGRHYEVQFLGDELLVYMHTGRPANDVYQLICLAIALKCGWLATPLNARRVASGAPASELAAGVHIGTVWATRQGADANATGMAGKGGFKRRGFTINVAKRMETASREGTHFRVNVSDPAFKRVNRRLRGLLFGPRRLLALKGVVTPVAVNELVDTLVDPTRRLAPQFIPPFRAVAERALGSNSFDLWTHSCLQVSEYARNGRVTDSAMDLCQQVLNIEPSNAMALYFLALGVRDRGDAETARLYLEDLTRYWPNFADGWLQLGRLLKQTGDLPAARRALLQSRRHGVGGQEEELPPPA